MVYAQSEIYLWPYYVTTTAHVKNKVGPRREERNLNLKSLVIFRFEKHQKKARMKIQLLFALVLVCFMAYSVEGHTPFFPPQSQTIYVWKKYTYYVTTKYTIWRCWCINIFPYSAPPQTQWVGDNRCTVRTRPRGLLLPEEVYSSKNDD
ncbi:unnamed protein product [Clavelina lepadiformis]|uniref:Uncharacterized protein n=1 Tax=Clavelina lepadiformis TaxID=159417 RepID=A0ABP0FYL5_CLALP